ncbi:MAG: metal-sulfur cluster assembly factor [Planctomycetes bacterium]|jgi:metal-sulfur cluster biosynthetic enzyme|nr:metal-sulfur cluster assembly factor [Planctomycetota bacterium]MBT4027785.1 metal-sulfur cluster assembly factor [Planctomycetota bacterium]MBT4559322.1 metal-sulfur cluster assembly factor [Planctomycetota bacterium]MBT5100961.1 metal-sulfur cluster assembly factor [Planctomycetota bacterium]MBT7012298.1 metal-sulfur cluster assembly factor [Planctomycetota bacterium]
MTSLDNLSADEQCLLASLETVFDPETGIGVVDMGLIYGLALDADSGLVKVTMTLTTPACPMADALTDGVKRRLGNQNGVQSVEVDLTFEPAWSPEMVSESARTKMGMTSAPSSTPSDKGFSV